MAGGSYRNTDKNPYIQLPTGTPRITDRQAGTKITSLPRKQKVRSFWLRLPTLTGMAIVLFLMIIGPQIVSWCQVRWDDMHYGNPRTFQTDAFVGHGSKDSSKPSHFIIINFNRKIEVIEFPGGDPTKAQMYVVASLYSSEQDLLPATGSFQDLNHDGLLDMIVFFQSAQIVYLNTGVGFKPADPNQFHR